MNTENAGLSGGFPNRAVPAAYLLLRVVAGLLFFQAGSMILFNWFGGMPPSTPPIRLLSETGIGGILEFFGGLAIVLGLFTRPVAFVLSGEMAVAYWQFHAPQATWPMQNQGAPAVLLCFIFLFMAAYGGGAWSIDAALRRRRERLPIAPPPPRTHSRSPAPQPLP